MASRPPQVPPELSPDPTSPVPATSPGAPAEPDSDDMAIPGNPATEPGDAV